MKNALVAIDNWKKHIFARILAENGYKFTEVHGLTADSMFLKVQTESLPKLGQVVAKAEAECQRGKR